MTFMKQSDVSQEILYVHANLIMNNDTSFVNILIKGKMQAKILLLLLILSIANSKLIYLFSFIRHGAIYPKNNLYDGNQTSQFKGQLTSVGMRQQFNLGTYLKKNYITEQQLTTPKFAPSEVQFFSSSYQRTQTSALSFIYGFYPLQEGWTIPDQVTADKLNPPYTPLFPDQLRAQLQDQQFALNKGFQPLPVRPLDDVLDTCPNYSNLTSIRAKQIAQRTAILELEQSLQITRMKSMFNLTNAQANAPTMSDLYQTILSDRYLGRPLPSQYSSHDQTNMKYLYQYYNTLFQDNNFARVMITPSLRMLRQKLQSSSKNETRNKLTFVFCHSSNLWPLLTQLNLTSAECINQKYYGQPITADSCVNTPYYASNLLFELHLQGSELYVRARYNGEYMLLCQSKQTKCSYSEFVSRLRQIQTNFEEQCAKTNNDILTQ